MQSRDWLIPALRERLSHFTAQELSRRFEAVGLPFAPITRPQDLFDDSHLLATGGLAPMDIPADASVAGATVHTRTTLLPLTIDGQRLQVRLGPPALGEHVSALLSELGYTEGQIKQLLADGIVGGPPSSGQDGRRPFQCPEGGQTADGVQSRHA